MGWGEDRLSLYDFLALTRLGNGKLWFLTGKARCLI